MEKTSENVLNHILQIQITLHLSFTYNVYLYTL